ncbi:MAG: DUF4097 domain-containing protein [Oscillospiraceae bacterium]|jgi:hypothetical protein|nr:DUF4097 domain-containing protein [Oscillospiraceae bacterium]
MKAKHLFLVIAASLVGLGLVICGITVLVVGGDFSKLNTGDEFTKMTYSISASDITSIVLKDQNRNVKLVPSEKDTIDITYYDNEKEYYSFKRNTEELDIEFDTNKTVNNSFLGIGLNFEVFSDRTVVISIPKEHYPQVNITTSNGKITAENLGFTADTAFSTVNGKVEITDCVFIGSLSVQSKNGRINLKDVLSHKTIDVSTTNARINLEGVNAYEQLKLETTNAPVEMISCESEDISVTTTNNSIDVINSSCTGLGVCRLTTSNGSITFDRFNGSLVCRTTNGKIIGTLTGLSEDYDILSSTTNASNNLPNVQSGIKSDGVVTPSLDVKTTNGAIWVDFLSDGGSILPKIMAE